jgi:hypothetical protein
MPCHSGSTDKFQVFIYCVTIARIQKLQQTPEGAQGLDSEVVPSLWKSLVDIIESQLTFLVSEAAYICHLNWAPTYSALTIAFISKYANRLDASKADKL